jgi:hypothetical protein
MGLAFLDTLGVGLLSRRTLSARDISDAAAAQAAAARTDPPAPTRAIVPAIVNGAFIRTYFEGKSPLGDRVPYKGDEPSGTWEIVGVVRDMKYSEPQRDIMPTVYLPAAGEAANFEVRAAGEPMALVSGIRAAVARLAPKLPLVEVKT